MSGEKIVRALDSAAADLGDKIQYLLYDISDCFVDLVPNAEGEGWHSKCDLPHMRECEVRLAREIIATRIDVIDPVRIIEEMETYHRDALRRFGELRERWTSGEWPPVML